jgi:hypothetical protein
LKKSEAIPLFGIFFILKNRHQLLKTRRIFGVGVERLFWQLLSHIKIVGEVVFQGRRRRRTNDCARARLARARVVDGLSLGSGRPLLPICAILGDRLLREISFESNTCGLRFLAKFCTQLS